MDKTKLLKKGWNTPEIKQAERIIDRAALQDIFFSKVVFWSSLIVIIFANLLVSLILIPFLIVLNSVVLYALVFLLAGTIGFLYNFLINDIHVLERKHHRIASILIPIIALANMFGMVLASNRFIVDLKVQNNLHNPWFVSIVFVIAFILPYFIDQLRKK